MRDYQTPATIKMYNLIALPLMVVFVAPYFAYLLDVYPDQRGLIFVLNLLLIFVTALLLSVQVCPDSFACLTSATSEGPTEDTGPDLGGFFGSTARSPL